MRREENAGGKIGYRVASVWTDSFSYHQARKNRIIATFPDPEFILTALPFTRGEKCYMG